MDDILKRVYPTIIAAFILSGVGYIWRFESVASEVGNIRDDMKSHYVKKEEFVVVQNDVQHIKKKTDKMDIKMDKILDQVTRKEQ